MVLEVFLTFDCEDFINDRAVSATRRILQLLDKYDLKGLFFLTGLMAEKLSAYPDIIELMENQEIGFHSSAHSVRPTLLEYIDVENFQTAKDLAIKRETSHINPITGKSEGRGGILAVKNLFRSKQIESFRSPGFCWSPSIIKAMGTLGLKYDFSTNLSNNVFSYEGMTFYPLPINQTMGRFAPNSLSFLFKIALRSFHTNQAVVLYTHPDYLVNSVFWDTVYYHGNPLQLKTVAKRNQINSDKLFTKWELLMRGLNYLKKAKLIEVCPKFHTTAKKNIKTKDLSAEYNRSMAWLIYRFGYKPKHIFGQFLQFSLNAPD